MTRLLTDGAESGDTSRVSSGTVSIVSSIKKTGSYSYGIPATSGGPFQLPWSAVASEYYIRMAIQNAVNTVIFPTISLLNGVNVAGRFRVTAWGTRVASIAVDDGTTSRATYTTLTWNVGEWHVIELHYKHAASPSGIIEVKFDGSLVISFTGAVNSQPQADRISFSTNTTSDGNPTVFDDIAVNDINGNVDNSWVGDGGVLSALVPTSTGTYVGFLASGSATTWQSIDEIPANSTDFAYSNVSGTKSTFVMSDVGGLPAGATISRIWVELYAKETVATGDKIASLLRSGVTNVTGTSQNLTIAFARYISAEYLTNPDTSGTWSVGDVNAIEAGGIIE